MVPVVGSHNTVFSDVRTSDHNNGIKCMLKTWVHTVVSSLHTDDLLHGLCNSPLHFEHRQQTRRHAFLSHFHEGLLLPLTLMLAASRGTIASLLELVAADLLKMTL